MELLARDRNAQAAVRAFYVALPLPGRPPDQDRLDAIKRAVAEARQAIQIGPDPTARVTEVAVAQRLGRIDQDGAPTRDFERDVEGLGGWEKLIGT